MWEFEKIHKVIYLEDGNSFNYETFKNNFFKEIIKNADKDIVQKVLSMRKDY